MIATRRALRGEVFYGWYIASAGAATNFLVIGIATFGFGVIIEPMRKELGWSLAAIAVAFSLRSFENGLLAPLSGFMVDRLGPRKMAVSGVVLVSVGLLMFSRAHDLWLFYSASIVMSLGQSVGSLTPFTAALMAWFVRGRGRAMGVLNSGNAAGYFAFLLVALVVSAVGWRSTLVIGAVVVLLAGVPLGLVLRGPPERYGLRPDGDEEDADEETDASGKRRPLAPRSVGGMSVADAVRTPAFYLLALAQASTSIVMQPWIIFQIPHLQNVGFSLQTAALIGSLYGIVQIGLRLVVGWLGDIVGRKRMLIVAFGLQGLGLLAFANLSSGRLWLLPVYYLLFGAGHASWLVLQMTMVADYFGARRFATLRGLSSSLMMPAGIISPLFAGWAFDRTGSYQAVFTVYAVLASSGAIWMLLIRRPMWSGGEPSGPRPVPAAAAPAGPAAVPIAGGAVAATPREPPPD